MSNQSRLGIVVAALVAAAGCAAPNPEPAAQAAQLSNPQGGGMVCQCPDGSEPAQGTQTCCPSCYGGLYPPRVDSQGCVCGCRECDCLGCGPDGDPTPCLNGCGENGTVCTDARPICCDPLHGICTPPGEACTL